MSENKEIIEGMILIRGNDNCQHEFIYQTDWSGYGFHSKVCKKCGHKIFTGFKNKNMFYGISKRITQ